MPKVKPLIAKTFDFLQSVISTLQNAGHYNNYNYNKNRHTFFVYPKQSLIWNIPYIVYMQMLRFYCNYCNL